MNLHLSGIEKAIDKYEMLDENDRHKACLKERIDVVLDKLENKE